MQSAAWSLRQIDLSIGRQNDGSVGYLNSRDLSHRLAGLLSNCRTLSAASVTCGNVLTMDEFEMLKYEIRRRLPNTSLTFRRKPILIELVPTPHYYPELLEAICFAATTVLTKKDFSKLSLVCQRWHKFFRPRVFTRLEMRCQHDLEVLSSILSSRISGWLGRYIENFSLSCDYRQLQVSPFGPPLRLCQILRCLSSLQTLQFSHSETVKEGIRPSAYLENSSSSPQKPCLFLRTSHVFLHRHRHLRRLELCHQRVKYFGCIDSLVRHYPNLESIRLEDIYWDTDPRDKFARQVYPRPTLVWNINHMDITVGTDYGLLTRYLWLSQPNDRLSYGYHVAALVEAIIWTLRSNDSCAPPQLSHSTSSGSQGSSVPSSGSKLRDPAAITVKVDSGSSYNSWSA